ncbi:hypothetical protein Tco_1283699 [Tanacetum coccineum]
MHGSVLVSGYANVPIKSTQTATKILLLEAWRRWIRQNCFLTLTIIQNQKGKEKVEENGPRKFPIKFRFPLEASRSGSIDWFLRRRLLHLLSWKRPTWVPVGPSKVALRQDLVLHNNAMGFLKSPNTLIAPKIANGFTTPRSRGRSAMYRMARTPYARSPSTFTEKGITSSYGREEALTSSESAFSMEGKWYSLEICLDYKQTRIHDTSTAGPRESEAASNEQSTQTATKILQHLEKMDLKEKSSGSTKSPTKLTLDMLHGQALRSLEKVDSPKLLSYPHDNQKLEVQHHERLHDSRELTSKGKEKVEENGPRKFPIKFIFL